MTGEGHEAVGCNHDYFGGGQFLGHELQPSTLRTLAQHHLVSEPGMRRVVQWWTQQAGAGRLTGAHPHKALRKPYFALGWLVHFVAKSLISWLRR